MKELTGKGKVKLGNHSHTKLVKVGNLPYTKIVGRLRETSIVKIICIYTKQLRDTQNN